jgi:exonuclease VII large subunit
LHSGLLHGLADLVADVRAATPSNAAQILVPDKNEIIRAVKYQVKSILPKVESSITLQSDDIKNSIIKSNSITLSQNKELPVDFNIDIA